MTREIVNPDARSTYRRYGKTPHQYSSKLREIGTARRNGNHSLADHLGREHSAIYGLRASSQSFTNSEE